MNRSVTVNGERYREMISNICLQKMQELDLKDMCFQQDGATCHTGRVTMDLLRGEFSIQYSIFSERKKQKSFSLSESKKQVF